MYNDSGRIFDVPTLKPLQFIRSSQVALRGFPLEARRIAGSQLLFVQAGRMPEDWKAMNGIGNGVIEIRIHQPCEYRVIYVAKFPEAIYVLHAFLKKSQKTPLKDLIIARKSYAEMLQQRKSKV